jgi:hypothetical protein
MVKSYGRPTDLSAQTMLIDISNCIIISLPQDVSDVTAVLFPDGAVNLRVIRLWAEDK